MMTYNGKTYYRIERNLFDEICVNGESLLAGDAICILKFDKEEPYEEYDSVFYGWAGVGNEYQGFQLLYNTDDNDPYESILGLWARIPNKD